MGLHRDPSEYGLGPIECHIRRMIWYQLCFLDIRTCEAQGPRPAVRDDEFDTRMPLNINDTELSQFSMTETPPPEPLDTWTDMTLNLIRMECIELHRVIWVDRPRLEKKQTNLTTVLGKIENTKRSVTEKYLSPAAGYNENIPLHRAGRLMMVVMITRAQAMVLHRYHNSVVYTIPDRLREIIITSGIECLEASIQLETDPTLRLWSWHHGAIQQYHTALLLMIEIFAFPYRKEANRIWTCLDYIFEIPPGMTREQKGRWVVTQVRDRVAFLMSNKKVKVPQAMMDKMGGTGPTSPSGVSTTHDTSPRSYAHHHQHNSSPQTHIPQLSTSDRSRSPTIATLGAVPPPTSLPQTASTFHGVGKLRSVESVSGEGIAAAYPPTSMAYPMMPSAQYIAPMSSAPPRQQRMAVAPAAPTSAPAPQQNAQAMIDIDWVSALPYLRPHSASLLVPFLSTLLLVWFLAFASSSILSFLCPPLHAPLPEGTIADQACLFLSANGTSSFLQISIPES